ncbi:M14 family metallopeptidase [Salipaludibacillus daqingensis]|uniref:M14 family metallopeptidase n=1 Tax=Salipaludibacillus daqingensis TaxID=3041001 RepID=UPI00247689E3|nr:M14 family metallopeptidase [Salipaludibacillus daqingensis]
MKKYFSESYEESRSKFREQLNNAKKYWPNATLETYHIGKVENDNTTDILHADAIEENEHLIIITTGEHGIEGYTGSAMLHLFMETYLPYINPNTTGLRLVHAVNPWGMRNGRRVSENNVDLNRNYLDDWDSVHSSSVEFDPTYEKIFVPSKKITNVTEHNKLLAEQLKETYSVEDLQKFKNAPDAQYSYPTSIFYGGQEYDEPTIKFKTRYLSWVKKYNHLLHIDMHTGGEKKDELTIFFMEDDERTEEELQRDLSFSLVKKVSDEDVTGDSKDYLLGKTKQFNPNINPTICLFEFGTIGDSLMSLIHCTQTMINENQLYFKGAIRKEEEDQIKSDFRGLFYPDDEKWKQQVIERGNAGLYAVLTSENILDVAY